MRKTKIQNDQMFMLANEIYSNAIIPSKKSEMWRKINLEDKVQVQGGIFGKSLSIVAGNVIVRGAIYCQEDFTVSGKKDGKIWIKSVARFGQSILAQDNVRIRFSADISSPLINLTNSIIYGNVYADEVILKNSVVLGGVFARDKLTMDNAIVGTFCTKSFIQQNNIGLILPFALSREKLNLGAKVYSIFSLSFKDGKTTGVYELFEDDIFDMTPSEESSAFPQYILTPSLRIFDFSTIQEIIQENVRKVAYISSLDHENLAVIDAELVPFDDIFFNLVKDNFNIVSKIEYSHFMDTDDETVNEWQNKFSEKSEDVPQKFTSEAPFSGYTEPASFDSEPENETENSADTDESSEIKPEFPETENSSTNQPEAQLETFVETDKIKCPICDAPVPESYAASFCHLCGAPLIDQNKT
ncbi:zinc ribbon domain-containing protein [candidate division KSB1 bacterium]|nr:zinc ribbon domain-containing protein [candidate division KSB1 bacterium]